MFYNIAQRTSTQERQEIFRVDIELYQHGSQPISVQNLQMLYYNVISSDLCNANEKIFDKSLCQGHFKVFSCSNTGTDS